MRGGSPAPTHPSSERLPPANLISQKSQQGKRKGGAALGESLSRLPDFGPFSPSVTNASYLVGVPTWIPQGNAESAHPPTTPGRSSSLILVAEHSCALISLSSRSHATPVGLASIARPPLFRAHPNTRSQDSLPHSKAHTRSQTSPRLR